MKNLTPKIVMEDVNMYYDTFHALKDISLRIPKNEITAFIVPRVCGKSSCLRTMNRRKRSHRKHRITGKVLLDDEDIYDPRTDVSLLGKGWAWFSRKPNPFPMSIFDKRRLRPPHPWNPEKVRAEPIVEEKPEKRRSL
jgi:phosphate transport system ATP-binding protein